MIYATITDLEARYGELVTAEAERAEILLADASAIIQQEGGKTDLTEVEEAVYRSVTCEMVHNVLSQPELGDISQRTQTAGPFTESFSFRTQPGVLRLTILQRKLLGLTKMKIGAIPPDKSHD